MESNGDVMSDNSNEEQSIKQDESNEHKIIKLSRNRLKENFEELEKIRKKLDDYEDSEETEAINISEIQRKIAEYVSDIHQRDEKINLYEETQLQTKQHWQQELAERESSFATNREELLAQIKLLRGNCAQRENAIETLTSSLDFERGAVSDLQAKLFSATKDVPKCDGIVQTEPPVCAQLSVEKIHRIQCLKQTLTSWVAKNDELGSTILTCMKEGSELVKMDNFIVPMTYAFETGNEHLTDQITLVFDCFANILAKYTTLTNYITASVKGEKATHESDSPNNDSGNEADLINLLSTECEISSCLSGSIESLKNLVEASISKIIMQKPAPMLRERQIFSVVCFLTVQLLQYFSLSQRKDRSRRPSSGVSPESNSFDFTSINFMQGKSMGGGNLEFSFDDCAQDASMTSLSVDYSEAPKADLQSAVFPQLVTALSGHTDSVDADLLQCEVKKFETSLEAAIGLIEAQLLSGEKEDSSLELHTLREAEVVDAQLIESLRVKLQKEEEDNGVLRQRLHHTQGLLNGARMENASVEVERIRLEECVCKLSRELQSLHSQRQLQVEVHTIHTNEGQDIQKVIRDSKDKVKTLLTSKKRKNLCTEDLISMNDELEGILQNILVESERSIDQLLGDNVDLSSQLLAAERKITANRRFIEEQICERDKDAELLSGENENLKKAMKEKDTQEELYVALTDEVLLLQRELLNKDNVLQTEITSREELNGKLGTAHKKIDELRGTIENLEAQLAAKFNDEDTLRDEVTDLKEKLEEIRLSYKQQLEFESGFEDNFTESNKCSDDEHPARKSESPSFGPSIMEEMGQSRSVVFETTLGIKRLEGLLEKVEKAVAANINCSRASISHCSEEDMSAKDTIDTSANLGRSLSPNSWECKFNEKLASFEMHIETLLKQNSDLNMQLKNAKAECDEIGAENESNRKRLDAIREALLREASETERKLRNRLQEVESENGELLKKNSLSLLKVSSLQATIDESKRVPPVNEELICRVSVLNTKLGKSESMLSAKTDMVNELSYLVKDLKTLLTAREEEIKRLISSRQATNDRLASGDLSKVLEVHNSDSSSNYSEVQRAALISNSNISEITKQSDILITKDSENFDKTLNHSFASQNAAIDSKVRLQTEQKIDGEPVNGSFSSEDSFSLNKEFQTLEAERTKLQEVCKMVEEKNDILLRDIELLTDQKLELESELAHAYGDIQAKDTLANLLKEKSVVQLSQVKERANLRVTELQTEKETIEAILLKGKNDNASLVKDLCDKEMEMERLRSDISRFEEKHKKDKMELEQQLFEQFTKNMEELADNLNREKISQIQELEENYKDLLSRQEENSKINSSQESNQETFLNLTIKDLERLKAKKLVKKVYKEGLAILALTESEKAHCSLLNLSGLSDSIGSLESRDTFVAKTSREDDHKYLIFCQYLEERIAKLEADKSIADSEIFQERMKYIELSEEKGMAQLKFDRQLKELEDNIQFYKTEAENMRRQIEFFEEQMLVEKSNRRKLRIKLDLETKAFADTKRMQDEIIKELKASLEGERSRMLKLVNDLGGQPQVENWYDRSVDNICTQLPEINNDFRMEAAIKEKTELLGELEEANYKIKELDALYKSLKLENNLLLSKMDHSKEKVAFLESQLIILKHKAKLYTAERQASLLLRNSEPRVDGRILHPKPSFRGEEITLRRTVATLQAQVDKLHKEKSTTNIHNLGRRSQQRLLEEISMEKQETVGLFKDLFRSQSDKETLRSMTAVSQASGSYDNKNIEMRTISTNTHPISYDEELKMKGQEHNRIYLWKLIESQEQLKCYRKALVFQKTYLLRSLSACASSENYFQSRLMSLGSRAIQLGGGNVHRGTQTALRPQFRFRGAVFAIIAIIRIRNVKNKKYATMHSEYFRLLKAISSDEIIRSDREAISEGARLTHLTHTPPTKDINVRYSAAIGASTR